MQDWFDFDSDLANMLGFSPQDSDAVTESMQNFEKYLSAHPEDLEAEHFEDGRL